MTSPRTLGLAGRLARAFIRSKLTPLLIVTAVAARRRRRRSRCRARRSRKSSCR